MSDKVENLSHPEATGQYIQFLGVRSVVCDACHGKIVIPVWWRGANPFPDPEDNNPQSLAARDMVDRMVTRALEMHKLNLDFEGKPLPPDSSIPRCSVNGFSIPASLARALRFSRYIPHKM